MPHVTGTAPARHPFSDQSAQEQRYRHVGLLLSPADDAPAHNNHCATGFRVADNNQHAPSHAAESPRETMSSADQHPSRRADDPVSGREWAVGDASQRPPIAKYAAPPNWPWVMRRFCEPAATTKRLPLLGIVPRGGPEPPPVRGGPELWWSIERDPQKVVRIRQQSFHAFYPLPDSVRDHFESHPPPPSSWTRGHCSRSP